jgi:hypothetical protein
MSIDVHAGGIWMHADIGDGMAAGSASNGDGMWAISGAGTAYGTSDKLHYVYQTLSGDQEIVANVTSCATTAAYGEQCGPMLRASLDAGSANAYCFAGEDRKPTFQWRLSTGASTGSTEFNQPNHPWYRLSVVTGVATCYWSDDGAAWTKLGVGQTIATGVSYQLGIGVSSNFDGHLATGLISDVNISALSTSVAALDFGGYRPHFQGFGVNTPGGRGGSVIKVTTLTDSGPGSLRSALSPAVCAPRFVVFEISGTIALSSPIYVTCPFVTLAGQTAPSPGITVRNHSTFIDTHDVVFQHVRFRMGDSWGGDADNLYIRNNAYNVVLDHLSLSWGMHENLGVNAWSGPQAHDIAVLDCIISEGLATPAISPFGVGNLFMDSPTGSATVARNLYAHNGNRNPWVGVGYRFAGYNNVIYNAMGFAGDAGMAGFFEVVGGRNNPWPTDVAWVSNVAIRGPQGHADGKSVKVALTAAELAPSVKIYLSDNTGPHMTLQNQWAGVSYSTLASAGLPYVASEAAVRSNVAPPWFAAFNFSVLPNASVTSHVLANAGARPLDRDGVDARVVQDPVQLDGGLIASPSAVGGYPVLAANVRALSVPANPHEVVDAAGRTRIEQWLESYARALESSAPPPTVSQAPTAPTNLRLVRQ